MIKKHHPQMSIILLGNSDFIVLSEKSEERNLLTNKLFERLCLSLISIQALCFSHYVKNFKNQK